MDEPSPYNPPLYLRNAHIQTVLNSQGLRKLRARSIQKQLDTRKITLQADDGTRLLAEFDRTQQPAADLVILLHGWEGSSQSSYMVTSASHLLSEGFDTLRVNLRDHGDSHHLNRALFNSTRSPEVACAIKNYVVEQGYEKIFMAGYSLGGSFALRIASDLGETIGLTATMAISPPIDPASAMDALNSGLFAYERYFFRRWHQSLSKKLELFPDLDFQADLDTSKSLDDLNRLFIPRHTVYKELVDYFAAYAITGDRLSALAMPSYLIAAEDDPIIPSEDLNRIDVIENLHIERHRYGGHCGFLLDLAAHSWVENRMVQLFKGHC
jgi:predicted alpha/beta-fold hydrolase